MSATAKTIGLSDAEWSVDGIPVHHLPKVWDDVWPYLQRAINRFPDIPDKFTEDQLINSLIDRKRQLWIGFDRRNWKVCGAVITEIMTDHRVPDGPICSIPLVGGDNWMRWGDAVWTTIKAWAVHQGCVACVGYGRRGWTRLYGFTECGTTECGVPVFIRRLKRG